MHVPDRPHSHSRPGHTERLPPEQPHCPQPGPRTSCQPSVTPACGRGCACVGWGDKGHKRHACILDVGKRVCQPCFAAIGLREPMASGRHMACGMAAAAPGTSHVRQRMPPPPLAPVLLPLAELVLVAWLRGMCGPRTSPAVLSGTVRPPEARWPGQRIVICRVCCVWAVLGQWRAAKHGSAAGRL
eukprot:jgi/Ulvmu1/6644/UM003_0282.1